MIAADSKSFPVMAAADAAGVPYGLVARLVAAVPKGRFDGCLSAEAWAMFLDIGRQYGPGAHVRLIRRLNAARGRGDLR